MTIGHRWLDEAVNLAPCNYPFKHTKKALSSPLGNYHLPETLRHEKCWSRNIPIILVHTFYWRHHGCTSFCELKSAREQHRALELICLCWEPLRGPTLIWLTPTQPTMPRHGPRTMVSHDQSQLEKQLELPWFEGHTGWAEVWQSWAVPTDVTLQANTVPGLSMLVL